MPLLKQLYRKGRNLFTSFSLNNRLHNKYDFNASNPLGGNGERVDIQIHEKADFKKMDVYQKSHWKRYEFARQVLDEGDICGDFACGTGYGAVLIASKATKVIGADINLTVIEAIKKRYKSISNVVFLHENLLHLSFNNCFNTIVSFETLEHFEENDIKSLLTIFNKALIPNGKLIFSTPYMQEKSEEALRMGFHLTFHIDEIKINNWLKASGFTVDTIKYQNYDTHVLEDSLEIKDFIICVARKTAN